jgi:ubiquinone/menaquinone biosynthesis C-methylase UbiE
MTTSWGSVAGWYNEHLGQDDTYHSKVIAPNLLRLMNIKKGEKVLDLACGQGFFSRHIHAAGALVTGVDISPELISIAEKNAPPGAVFYVSSADSLPMIESGSQDYVVTVLAIQNIAEVKQTFEEVKRVLAPEGLFYIVMNHPAFRIPKRSSWEWTVSNKEYRRIDGYLSESKEKIVMNPGSKVKVETVSFHRPLQYYSKLLQAAGFGIARIEEWISHRTSETGPRSREEDRMRKEIPLFLALEIKVLGV